MPDPDSAAVLALRSFRASMIALDENLMLDMGNRWIAIEQSLVADVAALAEEMARRTAAGEIITQQMIVRAKSYQIIREKLQDEIRRYNRDYAVARISQAQELAAQLGIDGAQSAIFASYPSPLSASFNRININAVESIVGYAGDGSPLYSLLKEAGGEAVDGLVNALVIGLGRGESAFVIAREMADGMGLGLDRALLIARTETNRAYRSGSIQQYRDSGVVTGFYRLVNKGTACFACLLLDGEEFELASEFEDHPNGLCMCVPKVRGVDAPEWDKGPDWFDRQDEAKQREILGNARYELFASGTPLSDFVTHSHSDVWGDAPAIVPLSQLSSP